MVWGEGRAGARPRAPVATCEEPRAFLSQKPPEGEEDMAPAAAVALQS